MKLPKISISYGYRALLIVLLIVAAVAGWLFYATMRKTTVVLNMPYDQAERRLFSALNLDKDELITREWAQSNVSGELEKSLTMGIHAHHLVDYSPGNRIQFWGDHSYGFFGSGREWIEIDLTGKDDESSTIAVDYFETTWILGVIPVTWQSGRKQERHIIATIFGEDSR